MENSEKNRHATRWLGAVVVSAALAFFFVPNTKKESTLYFVPKYEHKDTITYVFVRIDGTEVDPQPTVPKEFPYTYNAHKKGFEKK